MKFNSFRSDIDNIIKENQNKIDRGEVSKKLIQCLDLTSLSSIDNNLNIVYLIHQNDNLEKFGLNVAGICVFPKFVETIKNILHRNNTAIVSVCGGFPFGQIPLELCLKEIEFCLDKGCDEIDIVMNRGEFLCGNYTYVSQETMKSKELVNNGILKVIIETGELEDLELIRKASIINLESGADFIKTSTGKSSKGCDIYSFASICESLDLFAQKTGELKGIKASGGISSFDDAVNYYILFTHYFKEENLNKNNFRIGGSTLLKDLVNEIK